MSHAKVNAGEGGGGNSNKKQSYIIVDQVGMLDWNHATDLEIQIAILPLFSSLFTTQSVGSMETIKNT